MWKSAEDALIAEYDCVWRAMSMSSRRAFYTAIPELVCQIPEVAATLATPEANQVEIPAVGEARCWHKPVV